MNQRDIAKLAGVSSATVSRVINNDPSVSPKTYEKVMQVVRQHGYVQNAMARNLRMNSTKTIGYLVPDIKNPFFPSLLAGFQEMCFKRGYDIIFENTADDVEKEQKAIDTLMRYRVDGILAVFVDADKAIERFGDIGIPIVLIDRKATTKQKHDYLQIDNVDGMRQLVDYLVSLGHENIALIYGPLELTPGVERYRGFIEAMAAHGLKAREAYMLPGKFTEQASYDATQKLLALEKPPTAIIAGNNLACIGTYEALIDCGIQVPKQMALAGFDDFVLAAHLNPPITVLKRPTTEMGRMAAELLLERIDGGDGRALLPRTVILPTELCVRQSCLPIEQMRPLGRG